MYVYDFLRRRVHPEHVLVFIFIFSLFAIFNSKIYENSQCSRKTIIDSGDRHIFYRDNSRRTSRGSGRWQRIVKAAMRLTKSARDSGQLAAIYKNTPEVHESS
jgi:hypothetical protein